MSGSATDLTGLRRGASALRAGSAGTRSACSEGYLEGGPQVLTGRPSCARRALGTGRPGRARSARGIAPTGFSGPAVRPVTVIAVFTATVNT